MLLSFAVGMKGWVGRGSCCDLSVQMWVNQATAGVGAV